MTDTYSADTPGQAAPSEKELKLTDQDFLTICKAEFDQAIGMREGDEIHEDRIDALEYFKGEMDDVPAFPQRSKAVATVIADAVRTALPELIDVFVDGEEIGSFRPVGPDDVDAAKQETQAVSHVIMQQNDGFDLVYSGIFDALTAKVAVYHFYEEEYESGKEERFERQSAVAMELAGDEVDDVEEAGLDDLSGEPLYNFTLKEKPKQKVCVDTYAPEDFACARDTTKIGKSTYAVLRTRPRAQELIERGIDRDIVDELPAYSLQAQEETEIARDVAGEHEDQVQGARDSTHDLRQVVVYINFLRVDADGDGKTEVWRIDTDELFGKILQKEKLKSGQIDLAVGGAFKRPHRIYGESLADLLMEFQRIQTVLTRMHLDSGYFTLNQRQEVSEADANEHTIADLLNNAPGHPVRSRTGQALKPLGSFKGDFSTLEALEYFETKIEQRVGVVRNAQGINPDTLHDTARGAIALMNMAQRRLRLMARILAEGVFEELFIGVHNLLRGSGQQLPIELNGEWVQVNPASWRVRNDMTVTIGMGGGREHDLMLLQLVLSWMEKVIQAQQGFGGPLVTADNAYAALIDLTERAGMKNGAKYFSKPQPQQQDAEPPDPEAMKVQAEIQKMQHDAQLAEKKAALDAQMAQQKAKTDAQIKLIQLRADMASKQEQMRAEVALERERMRLESENDAYSAELSAIVAAKKAEAAENMSRNRPGGRLDR